MHGFILSELERFTKTALGSSAWPEILVDAGLPDRVYVAASTYPDHELRDLVVAATRRTGIGVDRVLFDFGRFLAPDLVRNYRHLLDPEWRTLDVIEHSERLVHRALAAGPQAAGWDGEPPMRFTASRSERGLVVSYRSRRALCAMARGIMVGLADHFGENVSVREPVCARRGARECTIHVREVRSTDQQLPAL